METSSTSSIIGALGGGSGVDMVKLASDLAAARFAARVQQLEAKNELLDTRISAASALRSQLSQLASALGDRIRTGDLATTPTMANSAVARVALASGVQASGTYQLEVEQLASSQTLASNAYTSAQDEVGEGALTIRFGAVSGGSFVADSARDPVTINVAAGATLSDVAAAINASGSGVTAYVANGTGGAQLLFKGAEGAANGFVIEASGASASSGAPAAGNIDYLAWQPASDSGQLRQTAQDARFKLDTVEMTAASNTVDGLPGGLSLTLTGTNVGAPTQIGFTSATGQIASVMGDFVSALNDITAQLRESADPLGGELGSDSGARKLKRELAKLPGVDVMPNAAPGAPHTLGDLGLAINRDGTFRLDSTRLNATLAANSSAAAAMFTTGLFGVYATMDNLARATGKASDPGTLAGSVARYTQQSERVTEQLADIADQQDRLRAQMVKQFAASDRNVSASQSTLSFLRNQIDAWNNNNG